MLDQVSELNVLQYLPYFSILQADYPGAQKEMCGEPLVSCVHPNQVIIGSVTSGPILQLGQ